ncbi:MAG: LLM class flavin-dependent oxidoreductase [bacterium]|nr:LLM class flavin-dependent oxidoreductase [bacterium]MDE0289039.1 LLM class flavin-dependent oxidoreductase [bacterium]MDE0437001.1 LLM class flavin-dependent oxidoreductase [bacterium]
MGSRSHIGLSRALAPSTGSWARLVRRAEAAGLGQVNSADTAGADCFVDGGVAVAVTSSIRLAVSVALPTRSPLQTAIAAGSLADLAPGRVTLGLGIGSLDTNETRHGAGYSPPLPRMMDFLRAVSALLRRSAGEPVTHEGPYYRAVGTGMGLEPEELPVILGAHGPRMTELAAAETDGVIVHIFTPLQTLAERLTLVTRIRPDPFWVGVGRPVAVHEDLDRAMELARLELAGVLSIPRFQPRLIELRGQEGAAEPLNHLREGRAAAAVSAIDDDLVHQFVTVTEPGRIVAQLAEIAGVDTVVPVPVGIFAPIVAARLGFDLSAFEESRAALLAALLE